MAAIIWGRILKDAQECLAFILLEMPMRHTTIPNLYEWMNEEPVILLSLKSIQMEIKMAWACVVIGSGVSLLKLWLNAGAAHVFNACFRLYSMEGFAGFSPSPLFGLFDCFVYVFFSEITLTFCSLDEGHNLQLKL